MISNKFVRVPAYYMIPDGKGDWLSNGVLIYESKRYNARIVVPSGEINDLASIPRLFRRIFSINGPTRPAAALHDYLYKSKGLDGTFTRKQCDRMFLDAMLSKKVDFWEAYPSYVRNYLKKYPGIEKIFKSNKPLVSKFVANVMFKAVRLGGGSHFQ